VKRKVNSMRVEVDVTIKLKEGVADPEGENTKKALNLLGFREVRRVKTMKIFRIGIEKQNQGEKAEEEEEGAPEVNKTVEEMCRKLLANPVIHDYTITICQT
jgi:phosphoribosylformylglycinamidine synthase